MSDEVSKIYNERSALMSPFIQVMDDLVGTYFGELPPEYDDYFHEEQRRHLVNAIRLSWDDLASMAGKIFPIYVDPDNDTPKAKERAEKQERIAYGYNDAGHATGSINMSMLMKVLSWWMVGCGEAVASVYPDYDCHTPFFTFRDPRHYFPPTGWSPFTQAAPDDGLFAYPITLGELKRRYPDLSGQIDRVFTKTTSTVMGSIENNDSTVIQLAEYYHRDTWIVQPIADDTLVLERSDDGDKGHPGIVPVVPMALYSPAPRARSIFADQISIQAAMARMFSQKLDFADRSLYPIIFTTPLSNNRVRVGPWAINEYDLTLGQGQPRVDVIGPQNAIDFDQTMAFTMGLQRMLNRNPEQFQGQAPGGRADSAKALASLKDSVVNTTIREMLWPPMIEAIPQLYTKAAQLDCRLWPSERKRASGVRKNQAFRLHYRPKVDLEGREFDFQIEPGIGLAGYQGTLEIMQLVGAELMPEDEAIEQGEWSRDAQETKRSIQVMRLEKIQRDDLTARAMAPPGTPGKLKPGAIAQLKKMVLAQGMDLFDAIEQLDKAGQYSEPMPEPMGMPGMGGPPGAGGLPPELAGLIPQPAAVGRPDLAVLQGGRG